MYTTAFVLTLHKFS